jgi:hypothetical protein
MTTAAGFDTYLAPGQRYTPPGAPTWRSDRQMLVTRLDRDLYGLPRVTFHCGADGTEVILYATDVETAIADGQLTPVVGTGWTARC